MCVVEHVAIDSQTSPMFRQSSGGPANRNGKRSLEAQRWPPTRRNTPARQQPPRLKGCSLIRAWVRGDLSARPLCAHASAGRS
jgi:hypothetical protein